MKKREVQSEKSFFSIIMPIYNAEKFLQKAVHSILAQTFSNFELLLIDDCSTDSSKMICNQIAETDSRVKLLGTSVNSGAAAARNLGIKAAKGRYLGFVDSDDTIDPDLFQSAYDILKKDDYDCLKFGLQEEYYDQTNKLKYSRKCSLNQKVYKAGNELYNQIINMEAIPLFGYLCDGFYKREIALENGIFMNEKLKVNEDFDFNIRYFRFVKQLYCSSSTGYHYAKRMNGSLTNQHQAYAYEVQMMKIHGLLDFTPQKLAPMNAERQKIFWMYVRFVYALLSDTKSDKMNKVIERIRKDSLYDEFLSTDFMDLSTKQKILVHFLKNKHKKQLKILILLIQKIREDFPILFAKMKH